MNEETSKRKIGKLVIEADDSSSMTMNSNDDDKNDGNTRPPMAKRPRNAATEQPIQDKAHQKEQNDASTSNYTNDDPDLTANIHYSSAVEDMIAVPTSVIFLYNPGMSQLQQSPPINLNQSQRSQRGRGKFLLNRTEAQCFLKLNCLAQQLDSLTAIASEALQQKQDCGQFAKKLLENSPNHDNPYLRPLVIVLRIVGKSVPNTCLNTIQVELKSVMTQLKHLVNQLRVSAESNFSFAMDLEFAGETAQPLAQAKNQLGAIQEEIACRIETYLLCPEQQQQQQDQSEEGDEKESTTSKSEKNVDPTTIPSMKDFCESILNQTSSDDEKEELRDENGDQNMADNIEHQAQVAAAETTTITARNVTNLPVETPDVAHSSLPREESAEDNSVQKKADKSGNQGHIAAAATTTARDPPNLPLETPDVAHSNPPGEHNEKEISDQNKADGRENQGQKVVVAAAAARNVSNLRQETPDVAHSNPNEENAENGDQNMVDSRDDQAQRAATATNTSNLPTDTPDVAHSNPPVVLESPRRVDATASLLSLSMSASERQQNNRSIQFAATANAAAAENENVESLDSQGSSCRAQMSASQYDAVEVLNTLSKSSSG